MQAYLGAIWNCRFFWLSLVKMDLRSRYRGSVLGLCWSLLHPIAMTTILCVVFKYAFKNQEMNTFAPLVFSGLTFWGFISASVVQGCGCFFQGESYIRQFPAPMAIYPLRNVLGGAFHFGIGLLLAIVIGLAYGPDVGSLGNPSATRVSQLLALPSLLPTCALLLLLGWSFSILFGLLSVRFRDTRHLTEIALQGLFYLTPIMYRIDAFKNQHRLTYLLHCNPLVPFLDLLREPILFGRVPTFSAYLSAATVVLVASLLAMVALRIEERRLIFHL
jgi:lipopolysaccharide transport system permease protein